MTDIEMVMAEIRSAEETIGRARRDLEFAQYAIQSIDKEHLPKEHGALRLVLRWAIRLGENAQEIELASNSFYRVRAVHGLLNSLGNDPVSR